MSEYGNVIRGGGKLKLKKGKKRKKEALVASDFVELPVAKAPTEAAGSMTDAERAHKKRLEARAAEDVEKTLAKSHRERVDELNNKLSELTEHNDIPRISAAGNG
mmetsp:Transcript_12162/g.36136  ORF Transcript_12162/g.36136 Transcript_12162/m.36136 type:complete len:105 (+) Transcript_12162:225-539(+)|eukprot:CAMPEP_0119259106 /NCGR_PEP_ID=MMETSP1329-20130426/58_1 /TAXON_ID=114041 /ORGANISM="Genus nov. species nov., Strain RCC1024" /LENGTH=104 /DNA_ID=CAMNT_0007258467 /DNA_START=185 /DNA_END=499 /DNA_ORIENTATION=+